MAPWTRCKTRRARCVVHAAQHIFLAVRVRFELLKQRSQFTATAQRCAQARGSLEQQGLELVGSRPKLADVLAATGFFALELFLVLGQRGAELLDLKFEIFHFT